jgi:hypothetical protein
MSYTKLDAARVQAAVLKERLQRALGDEFDEEIFAASVESETDFFELIARLLRDAIQREAMAEALKAIIDNNRDRKARMERGAETIRGTVVNAMAMLPVMKREFPDMTVSVTKLDNRAEIFDSTQIPQEYWKPVTVLGLDRDLILRTLQEGRDVPGARLEIDRLSLTIRKK